MPDLETRIVIRLSDRTRAGTRSARRNIHSIRDSLEGLQRRAQQIGGSFLAFEAVRRVTAGTVGTFSAIEDGLVGVAKTADLTGQEVERLQRRIEALSVDPTVGLRQSALLEISQAAGQLGVQGVSDLTRFTRTVAQLEGATDLAGEVGATSLARILNVTGDGIGTVDRLGSVITRLGNTFAATESEITQTATRVATATAVFGVSSAEAAAFGAAMRSLGLESELGATAVGRGLHAIDAALRTGGEAARQLASLTGQSIEELRGRFVDDAVGVFRDVVAGMGGVVAEGGSVAAVLEALGIEGERANQVYGTLAKRIGVLDGALSAAADEWRRNTALTEEALRASQTFSRQMQIVRNEIDAQAAGLGEALAPALLAAARNWELLGIAAAVAAGRIANAAVTRATALVREARADRAAVVQRVRGIAQRAAARRNETLAELAAARAARDVAASQRAAFGEGVELARATGRLARARRADALAASLQTKAQAAHNLVLGRGAVAARLARGALGLLGGPIGAITTALTLGALAWAHWGGAARGAAREAEETLDERIERITRAQLTQTQEVDRAITDLDARRNLLSARISVTQGDIAAARARLSATPSRARSARMQAVRELEQQEEEELRALARTNRQRERLVATRDRLAAGTARPTPLAPGGGDSDALAALADIRRQAEDRIAQLTLDRIALVNRAERQQLDELGAVKAAGTESERAIEAARTAIVRAAQVERDRIYRDDLIAREEAQQDALDAADAARDELGDALASPYERATREARRWGDETRAVLHAAGASAEDLAAVEEAVQQRIATARRESVQAAREAAAQAAQAARESILASNDIAAGARIAFEDYASAADGAAEVLRAGVTSGLETAEDALVKFAETGRLEFTSLREAFTSLVNSILVDLTRIAIRRSIIEPVANYLGDLFGSADAGVTYPAGTTAALSHAGGIAGSELIRRSRTVPREIFAGAPRLHGGGFIGPGEVPTILRRGEGVFTPGQMAALGRQGPPEVRIEFVNRGTPQRQVGDATTRFDDRGYVIGIVLDDLANHGPIRRSLRAL